MKRELVGKQFGRLTVLEKTDRSEERYCVWKCRCTCGGIIYVNTKHLVRGTVQDCGCVPKKTARRGSIAEDLSGKKFGLLTALHQTRRAGRVAWLCQCICGARHIATAHDLKEGKVKSCGCIRHMKTRNYSDIKGLQFGRLTALEPTCLRDRGGSVIWKCQCQCGNTTYVSKDVLKQGSKISCGCRQAELRKEIPNRLTYINDTCIEILEKRKHRSDNTSGFRGVWRTKSGKYKVGIGFRQKKYHVGTFDTFEEAVRIRLYAEQLVHEGFVETYREWINRAKQDPQWGRENPLFFDVSKINGEVIVSKSI